MDYYDESEWEMDLITGLKIMPKAVDGKQPILEILRNPRYKGPSGEKIWNIDCAE